ncbi:hypothetical protein OS493_022259 [Desmophyllum pertusum]|uniref:Carboxylic ester hydrolase n=1 Tax=Desmophyllum pertusum TaxID=174260 RepID=A0A9W9YAX0_9CNID|nr:hypothetical protein OS493_022259 [Desmophyllum pertusum]
MAVLGDEVEMQAGVVRGRKEGEALVFKGIPYAKPPSGERRWKPPVPCEKNTCWSGTFNASQFGSICAQQDFLGTTGNAENVIGSEDCLFVNVWAPKERPKGELLPVLVFIHGGYLLYLSGNWKGFHPSPEMVVDMNIVAVSFNYRLNAFGFLALQSLSDSSSQNTSGNYGFMDQIMAFKWVKKNIEKFGGDPKSVTLMGSSSGGTSELALLASPGAAGLFHRAIIMSASAVFNKSSVDAARDNEIFVRNSNCVRNSSTAGDNNLEAERDCLYKLTPRQVQDAIPWSEYPNWRMDDLLELPTKGRFVGAVAVVDGAVVSDPPLVAMANGKANDVPLIIGTTAQEIDIAPSFVFKDTALVEYRARVQNRLGNFSVDVADSVLNMYNQTLSNGTFPSLQFAYTSMVTDLRATCPNNRVAKTASQGFKSSVYRYVVTNRPTSPVSGLFGFPSTFAFHMWDLLAFFGFPSEVGYQPSAKDKNFMKDLRREFGEFINKGTVKQESWKEYPSKTALFADNGVQVPADEYHKEQCDFWLNNGFFSYAWIN